jgi:hypothetical protein
LEEDVSLSDIVRSKKVLEYEIFLPLGRMRFGFDADWIEVMFAYRMAQQSSKSDVSLRDCGGWEI